MGNYLVLSKEDKVLRVLKTDGKVLEFRAPTLVKDILSNFSGVGISLSKQASEQLSPDYKLKLGKVYYMIPLPSSAENDSAATRRIKIVVTKQRLQELLTKQISVEEVLSASGPEKKASSSCVDSSKIWKPKLKSITEGIE
ncbi:hypothetical protein ACFX13_002258 [Malus domestica]|uniref:uncharacterized protein n=1 Tax=Malus domestica TaxID=3750 RepID=UPI0010AB2572|nr:uncharacterized protein LOC103406651 [Malus domestica]XP_050150133.1 uncharacterized protein LOC126625097 [Malus sylvestris]